MNLKKIKLKDAKPEMKLAKDVVTSSGIVILSKDSFIKDSDFYKLEKSDIKYIFIYDDTCQQDNLDDDNLSYFSGSLLNNEEFIAFKKTYDQKLVEVEKTFIAIGNGNGVQVDNLYNMVSEILEGVGSVSSLLTYLVNLKKQDSDTFSHSINVGITANLFGGWLGFTDKKLKNLTISAVLHDIGKILIDKSVITKPSKLTDDEYEYVKKHAFLGYELVKNLDFEKDIKMGILMHHEKIDGSGYPNALKQDDIHLFGRIISICDIYEAMTSDRVYRLGICPFKVIKELQRENYSLLDTKLLISFLENIAYTYVGNDVMLSNNQKATVVFINKFDLSSPIVRLEDNSFINLSEKYDLEIDHIIY